jgi:hypothetical protein
MSSLFGAILEVGVLLTILGVSFAFGAFAHAVYNEVRRRRSARRSLQETHDGP